MQGLALERAGKVLRELKLEWGYNDLGWSQEDLRGAERTSEISGG